MVIKDLVVKITPSYRNEEYRVLQVEVFGSGKCYRFEHQFFVSDLEAALSQLLKVAEGEIRRVVKSDVCV